MNSYKWSWLTVVELFLANQTYVFLLSLILNERKSNADNGFCVSATSHSSTNSIFAIQTLHQWETYVRVGKLMEEILSAPLKIVGLGVLWSWGTFVQDSKSTFTQEIIALCKPNTFLNRSARPNWVSFCTGFIVFSLFCFRNSSVECGMSNITEEHNDIKTHSLDRFPPKLSNLQGL